MPTVCFRGGCLTGPQHAGTQLHGFLGYLMKCTVSGDPYTVFYTPKEYREMLEDQSGNFVGIGSRLDTDSKNRVVIIEPIEDSPAEAAGIQSGDVIVAVDGKSVIGIRVDDVIDRIRGEDAPTFV